MGKARLDTPVSVWCTDLSFHWICRVKHPQDLERRCFSVQSPGERFSAEVIATLYGGEEGYQGALRRLQG